MPAEEPIQNIETKLKEVSKRYNALKKENLRLQELAKKLNESITLKEAEITVLQRQTDILKSGIGQWQPQQKKIFARRIDVYLKEIDKCIALLNE